MLMRICLVSMLLAVVPAWSQTAQTDNSGPDQVPMLTPPPISDQPFARGTRAEGHTNYLGLGLVVSAGYIDNMYAGNGAGAQSEGIFSIWPSISIEQDTRRQVRSVQYSPGFTFYEPSSTLNQANQTANLHFKLQLSPHTGLDLSDTFQRSSTTYGASLGSATTTVSGTLPTSATAVIPPYGELLTNTANAEYALQLSPRDMVGASAFSTVIDFPNANLVPGLYDSHSTGGSGFYNRQLNGTQYFGLRYDYVDIVSHLLNIGIVTKTNTILPFYSIYPVPHLSLSISGGPQQYTLEIPGEPNTTSWNPSFDGSVGWQGLHTAFAASYSKTVTSGGGLLGAYHSSVVSAVSRWQMSRAWTSSASTSYASYSNVGGTSSVLLNNPGGNTLTVTGTLGRALTEHVTAVFEYDRLQQSYSTIQAIAYSPNSDREMVSLNWNIRRPLGR